MKRIIHYISFVAAVFAAASCVEPIHSFIPGQDLTLSFSCGVMTKADGDRLATGNEDLIKQIDYFIFPINLNEENEMVGTTPWVHHGHFDVPNTNNPDGISESHTYTDRISHDDLLEIFQDGATEAMVFAIANYVGKYGPTAEEPITEIPSDATTWEDLHALVVGPTFFKDGGPGFQLRWPRKMDPDDKDLFFVMTGEEKIALSANNEIPLYRLASKVTVEFNYVEYYEDDNHIRWYPQKDGEETRVYLSNAIEHTTLGGPLNSKDLTGDSWGTATQPLGNGNRDIFEYAYDFMTDIPTVDGTETGKKIAHYYTYPLEMDPGDDNQPYLKLVLPWYGYQNYGDADNPDWRKVKQKEVYYKITLPYGTINEGNKIYEYSVDVNIIGTEKEVRIIGERYKIKDWTSDEVISTNVATGRYISLDIPKDFYDMYSSKVQILFVASGEVEISKLQIYKLNLASTPIQTVYYINGTPTSYVNPYSANTLDAAAPTPNPLSNWVSIQGSQLVVNHTLNTDINDNSVDISPYTFVVTLHLKAEENDTKFDRTVTITQYPPIYAQTSVSQNSSTVYLNGTQYSSTAQWVDNNAGEHMGAIGGGSGTTAQTKTVVSVTTLSNLDISLYETLGVGVPVIGDPRIPLSSKYPVNPFSDQQVWETQDLGDASNDYIEDYKYAATEKRNVIAPKFMLSSGFAGTNNVGGTQTKVDWIHNVERCASYQEDGYPAGRWRLPTEAEILFVYTLAHDRGVISNPFYDTSHYWANSGRQYYNRQFVSGTGSYSARCVYDLWYWGDEPYDNNGNPITEGSTASPATNWLGFKTTK